MEITIKVQGLSRVYETYEKQEGVWNSIKGIWSRKYQQRVALAPTDLEIPRGQMVGLVGANGAGKTTLLKLLSGLIHPSVGTAHVLGHEPWQREDKYLRRISILLGQKNQLWWDISPLDSYALLARIYELDLPTARRRADELATLLDCTHVLKTQLRRLSLGERMKMEIIGSLLHEPEVLFLDEPTIGLDVVAQTTIRAFLDQYVREKQPTVILTSHYMDDIAKLAKRLLLISHGKIVYDGTVDGFVGQVDSKKLVRVQLEKALTQDKTLTETHVLSAGQQLTQFSVSRTELPGLLQAITQLEQLHDIQVQEVDFEEVIREFLQKESRLRKTSHSH